MSQSYFIAGIYTAVMQLPLSVVSIVQHSRRRRTESRLRELNHHLMRAQEEERKRIARELHDDFGQRLALVRIDFEVAMQEYLSPDCGIQSRIQSILAEIDELSTDIQHLSHTLHSGKLEYMGLKPALKDLCGQVERQNHIAVALHADDLTNPVSKEIELCLYRVVQEALHNIVKHSCASRAVVKLFEDDPLLRMEISDNGKGFIEAETSQGLGLASMRERLSIVQGELQVRSTPGHGTILAAQVPFAEPVKRHTDG